MLRYCFLLSYVILAVYSFDTIYKLTQRLEKNCMFKNKIFMSIFMKIVINVLYFLNFHLSYGTIRCIGIFDLKAIQQIFTTLLLAM